MPALITLLTDFGTADGYVAQMKGVLYSQAPGATVVDVAHDLPAHDVEYARLTVAKYWRRFPAGTVHVCVVDPGVGSSRAAIAVASGGRFLVGPDNGILSPALLARDAQVVALPVPPTAAPTFHGRDLFAPVAAQLATGASFEELGAPHDAPIVRRTPEAVRGEDGGVHGEIIAIDRFGNAVTNVMTTRLGECLECGVRRIPVARTYADASPGTVVAVIGSGGLLEIAVRDGSAERELGLRRGDRVIWRG